MMSSINFASLKASEPSLSRSWELLEQWVGSHAQNSTIVPGDVVRYISRKNKLSTDDAIDLNLALEVLVRQGILAKRFALESSSGQILYPYYVTRKSIPKKVLSTFDEYVDSDQLTLRPIFVYAEES
jgi:hypothetical protein